MTSRRLMLLGCIALSLTAVPLAGSAAGALSCDDIEWTYLVTNQYPDIAKACDAVVERDGRRFARVRVEVLRVSGTNVTFRVVNNDGTSGGSFTQNVGIDWRATIGGVSHRASDLIRGQTLNVYLPGDRWEVMPEVVDDRGEGPDVDGAAAPGAR